MWYVGTQSLVVNPATIIPERETNLILIQGNSLVGFYAPNASETRDYTKEDIIDLIKISYPERVDLLVCMVRNESTYCTNEEKGDHGLAYGCFQIHIDKHDITEWCALDFECSLDWTVKMIKEGKGYLWTTYKPCLVNPNY